MNPERIGKEGIAIQDAAEEFQFEVELALFSETSRCRFGGRALGGGVAGSILVCGHRRDAPFPVPTVASSGQSLNRGPSRKRFGFRR